LVVVAWPEVASASGGCEVAAVHPLRLGFQRVLEQCEATGCGGGNGGLTRGSCNGGYL
jgi:hypothetical protein